MTSSVKAAAVSRRHRRIRRELVPPSMAWLVVFVPALAYFVATRLGSSLSRRSLGTVVSDHVVVVLTDKQLQDVFFLSSSSPSSFDSPLLHHPLYLMQSQGLQQVSASLWKHDSDLGRGYLLLSQSCNSGRIWRWEVGGGPIPIGRTLYMEPSGCRSNAWRDCPSNNNNNNTCNSSSTTSSIAAGSGPLAVDFSHHDHSQEGRLIVAEYGERRIVRLEESTGARTPLILHVPDVCSKYNDNDNNNKMKRQHRRLDRPTQLVMTPFGDLLVLEESPSSSSNYDCTTLYRLPQAVHVEPLMSAMESRRAHKWEALPSLSNNTRLPQVVYHNQRNPIGSMALDPSWTSLYLTLVRPDTNHQVWLALVSILEEEEEISSNETRPNKVGLWDGTERWVANLSLLNVSTPPKAMAVDRKGHVFLGVDNLGVMVLDGANGGAWLGTLPVPSSSSSSSSITSLTLGEDGHLYVTTTNELMRIRVKHGAIQIPTNMIPKPKAKTATQSW